MLLCVCLYVLCSLIGAWEWHFTDSFHDSDSGKLTFSKETAHSWEWLVPQRPTHIKQCPIGCSLRKIVVHPKLIGLIPAAFCFRSIEICIGNIKTASNFTQQPGLQRPTVIIRQSSARTFFWCINIWILIMASACSFGQKFWPSGIATHEYGFASGEQELGSAFGVDVYKNKYRLVTATSSPYHQCWKIKEVVSQRIIMVHCTAVSWLHICPPEILTYMIPINQSIFEPS